MEQKIDTALHCNMYHNITTLHNPTMTDQDFATANENGDLAQLEQLINDDSFNLTNSHFLDVVEQGHKTVVQLMLKDHRIDINYDNSIAVSIAGENNHKDVVELLLRDPKCSRDVKQHGLYWAVLYDYDDIVEFLLRDKGFPINCTHYDLIGEAVENSNLNIFKMLLADSRIDPSVNKSTSLRMAILGKNKEMAKLLINDPRVDLAVNNYRALLCAWSTTQEDVFEMIVRSDRISVTHNLLEVVAEMFFDAPQCVLEVFSVKGMPDAQPDDSDDVKKLRADVNRYHSDMVGVLEWMCPEGGGNLICRDVVGVVCEYCVGVSLHNYRKGVVGVYELQNDI